MTSAPEPIIGELVTAGFGLGKCCPCLDDAITKGGDFDPADLPDAVTLAPSLQTFTLNTQEISAPCTIPVCVGCRRKQRGYVSKNGLFAGR